MLENEFIYNRKSIFKGMKYIMVIKTETAESSGGGSWEGKLNTLKRSLEESSESHIEHLRKLNTNLDKLLVIALEEKIRPIEEKINAKM